ncbi:hypothetical protein D9758_018774 [Tetrapyrgos nigripes]|uniref:Uncharacterized protein n=1 Tax=Tetrapyrgos nigripes TaxID=182062 RepID=A0A8H5B6T6_9AGAR|nr:hypothetical protein D9758_018774 [Tetrapyrgos nigripes]
MNFFANLSSRQPFGLTDWSCLDSTQQQQLSTPSLTSDSSSPRVSRSSSPRLPSSPSTTLPSSSPRQGLSTGATPQIDIRGDISGAATVSSAKPTTVKIRKPAGEVGRPGRGGYTLSKKLGWDSQVYADVKKYINSLCKQYLDTTRPLTEQDLAKVELLQRKARTKYPQLTHYAEEWATDDFMQSHLKYKKSRLLTEQLKRENKALRAENTELINTASERPSTRSRRG